MSRIGKKLIPIPEGVKISIESGCLEASGPLGTFQQIFPKEIIVEKEEDKFIKVSRPSDTKKARAFHGLTRALISNAVTGVSKGFEKKLDILGVGYNAKLKGKHLELQVGYCLPKVLMIPDSLTIEVPAPTRIIIKGCNKQEVGEFAAQIRKVRPPNSYVEKGIKYVGEVIKLKEGKSTAGK